MQEFPAHLNCLYIKAFMFLCNMGFQMKLFLQWFQDLSGFANANRPPRVHQLTVSGEAHQPA